MAEPGYSPLVGLPDGAVLDAPHVANDSGRADKVVSLDTTRGSVLAWTPNQGRYSPLWDVHLTRWADGQRPRLPTEFADVEDLAEDGRVGGFPDGAWGPSGFVVNCRVIAEL